MSSEIDCGLLRSGGSTGRVQLRANATGNVPDTCIMEWLPSVRFISMMQVSGTLPVSIAKSERGLSIVSRLALET
jgi:hypothetical protein